MVSMYAYSNASTVVMKATAARLRISPIREYRIMMRTVFNSDFFLVIYQVGFCDVERKIRNLDNLIGWIEGTRKEC